MDRKTSIAAAALAALTLTGCSKSVKSAEPMGATGVSGSMPAEVASDKKGECWGVNACKGQGACGGVGHECAGQNACKGQGWLSLTKADCSARNGKFKAQ
ncbi:MAG: hypothetical protein HYZ74_04345 [Elusimicrobia bacterium]|nr:hypothetical protein [Elusimicrobiota bacterium]